MQNLPPNKLSVPLGPCHQEVGVGGMQDYHSSGREPKWPKYSVASSSSTNAMHPFDERKG